MLAGRSAPLGVTAVELDSVPLALDGVLPEAELPALELGGHTLELTVPLADETVLFTQSVEELLVLAPAPEAGDTVVLTLGVLALEDDGDVADSPAAGVVEGVDAEDGADELPVDEASLLELMLPEDDALELGLELMPELALEDGAALDPLEAESELDDEVEDEAQLTEPSADFIDVVPAGHWSEASVPADELGVDVDP